MHEKQDRKCRGGGVCVGSRCVCVCYVVYSKTCVLIPTYCSHIKLSVGRQDTNSYFLSTVIVA